MPEFRTVRQKPELSIDRLDGGLNKKDGPSYIDDTESPSCLNVTFGDRGSVETREGTSYYSQYFETKAGDGGTVYQGTMVVWYGGKMYRMSGNTGVVVSDASGAFTEGQQVAYEQYQDILFCSDGTNGPYRYEGGQSFYNMGIDVPSAPTAVCDAANGSAVSAGTYVYGVTFVNTHVAEGEIGSASADVTLATTSTVNVTEIPTGTDIQGVASRYIYRRPASASTWGFVKEITDNTTTSFTDSVANADVGGEPPTDASSPKPFSAIRLHKERLWMPDDDNETLLRYTEFDVPFVSKALNFVQLAKGDGSNIRAIGVQNDLITAFKANSIFVLDMSDPTDDTTIQVIKSPANGGIVGMRAFVEEENGIIFMMERNKHIIGLGYLSGIGLVNTQDNFLVSKVLTKKIEEDILQYPPGVWSKIAMTTFKNRIYIAVPATQSSTTLDGILLFDVNRIVYDDNTDPGSWAPWDGVVGSNDFMVFDDKLYSVCSGAIGSILQFNNGSYTDADGSAINSYWWSKELGGSLESWIKDFRHVVVWFERLGSYFMNLKIRLDGNEGAGDTYQIDLTPSGALWNNAQWNNAVWGPASQRIETENAVGPKLGKRIQVGFDNQNTAGQGFKIHSLKVRFNLRRQR